MGYTESHACKATHHETVNYFQIPSENKTSPLNFSHKSAKAKPQQNPKSDKFRTIKKGVPQVIFILPCDTP